MKYKLLGILIILQILVFSQTDKTFILYGKIIDESSKAISYVNISSHNSGTVSNQSGEFFLPLENLQTSVRFSHIKYQSKTLIPKLLKNLKRHNDTLISLITLQEKTNSIKPVIVASKSTPIEVASNQLLDYDFYKGELVYLIKKYNGVYIKHLKTNKEYKLPFETALSLQKDLFGELHVLNKDSAYQVYLGKTLKTYRPLTRTSFKDSVLKYLISTPKSLIYRPKIPTPNPYCGQRAILFKLDKNTKKRTILLDIFDQESFKVLYQDSMSIIKKYYDIAPELMNQIENGSWNGTLDDLKDFHNFSFIASRMWYKKIMYKPLYFKIIKLDDKYCIFDYVNDLIYHYDYNDTLIKTIHFPFSKTKHIQRTLLFDEIKQKSYIVMRRNGCFTLKHIDLESGEIKSSRYINKFYPKNIKVNDGFVYFIVERSGGGHDKLYKLPL